MSSRLKTALYMSALMIVAPIAALAVTPKIEAKPPMLNQIGFTPASKKIAIADMNADKPTQWALKNAAGEVVKQGQTKIIGFDAASGQKITQIDFSDFTTVGKGYVIEVGRQQSAPFDISPDVYATLKYDALAFFYHQRVSVPIEAKYVGERWARPIAHEKEVVTCWGPKDQFGNDWGGCPYSLDVSKGWYDAGDHGKYVVNGGISVWTLMNAYEHGLSKGTTAFDDGKVKIPEAGNGQNDLLDEVRFEMDFMMAMQVPDGTTLRLPLGDQRKNRNALKFTEVDASGMAHHKMHDEHWTALPMPPHLDKEKRGMNYPATGATLNLAASAAQCARLFKGVDDAYAAKCLTVAQKAYAAAKRVPDAYAIDILPGGGGGYGDGDFTDEFYWAAAELFLTTGEAGYEADLKASPHYMVMRDFSWGGTAPLGTLSLATAAQTPAQMKTAAQKAIVTYADGLRAETPKEGYHIPFGRSYGWGSNSDFANRGMALALAADFTGDKAYRDEVVHLMDYILGRNPLGMSYVSGYGEKTMQHPHHRFWVGKDGLPPPPPGVLAGGPNARPAEADLRAKLANCAPQTCYLDVVESYSMNEVAINWNAPLVWVAWWLDEGAK